MSPTIRSDVFSPDIFEFIVLLHRHDVRYVIVGGEAVIFYGYARVTGDIDFFYERTEDNLQRLHGALVEFWQGEVPGVQQFEDLANPGSIIQFGLPPNRIDLINCIDGVGFDVAWRGRTEGMVDAEGQMTPIYYIGLKQLLENKRASGRHKDLDDLRFLRAALDRCEQDP